MIESKIFNEWNKLSSEYRKRAKYDDNQKFFTLEGNKNFKSAMISNKIGNAYLSKGEVDKAISFIKNSLTINPNDKKAWNNLGKAYLCIEDFNKAIKAFNKAIKIDSNYRKAWNNLGFQIKKTHYIENLYPKLSKLLKIIDISLLSPH